MTKRKKSPGLFTGWWVVPGDPKHRIKPIRRSEYGELYRLERLGRELGLQRNVLENTQAPK